MRRISTPVIAAASSALLFLDGMTRFGGQTCTPLPTPLTYSRLIKPLHESGAVGLLLCSTAGVGEKTGGEHACPEEFVFEVDVDLLRSGGPAEAPSSLSYLGASPSRVANSPGPLGGAGAPPVEAHGPHIRLVLDARFGGPTPSSPHNLRIQAH